MKIDFPYTKSDAVSALQKLRGFIGRDQLSVIGEMCHGEERRYMFSKLVELAETVEKMPATYETDGQGDEAIAHLHYFHASGADWYITEKDLMAEQHQAFGLAVVWERELGYISINEILANGAELDLHWTPKTLAEIKFK